MLRIPCLYPPDLSGTRASESGAVGHFELSGIKLRIFRHLKVYFHVVSAGYQCRTRPRVA